ncbi:MAG: bifunctional proline dehydrogenase/L-glutamate gamma-semialdehyde dehydrogenase, partial [Candidatus Margulisbacteria bacterium]|nr:bifunctional proline dehydrogenase/L-glutamate gamma-semialdehyde dehydrogenase [Candidatus Margulisiibacteriota bacterium]
MPNHALEKAKYNLKSIQHRDLSSEQRQNITIDLAGLLLTSANQLQTKKEKCKYRRLGKITSDQKSKQLLSHLTDQAFRSKSKKRIMSQLIYIFRKAEISKYLSQKDRFLISIFIKLGPILPQICVSLFQWFIKYELSSLVFIAHSKSFNRHLAKRSEENIQVNVNYLGETVLGIQEAKNRVEQYCQLLKQNNIPALSLKLSSIDCQLNVLDIHSSKLRILQPLRHILRMIIATPLSSIGKHPKYKLLTFDMESYSDLQITVEVFKHIMQASEFLSLPLGIALQAYIPDSYHIQQELTKLAKERVKKGGHPIHIRLVKGANLGMEHILSSQKNWPDATYQSKLKTDANYKRMMMYGCEPENAKYAHIGIGSHNLFDIAYALVLRAEKGSESYVTFELLEGMAKPLQKIIHQLAGRILLYTPVTHKDHFHHAAAYLIRRFDENSGPEHFLKSFYNLKPDSREWNIHKSNFIHACEEMNCLNLKTHRIQSRPSEKSDSTHLLSFFKNEPDTDWSICDNRTWIQDILKQWSEKILPHIPNVIGEEQASNNKPQGIGIDPSRNCDRYTYDLADLDMIKNAIDISVRSQDLWAEKTTQERSTILHKVSQILKKQRGTLIGAMVADTGKIVSEADIEVSEAIDFCEYYRHSILELTSIKNLTWSPLGTVLVTSPWNFPCAIPTGCIASALLAGNTVIFKPAPEAVLIGFEVASCFWEAGIPKSVLQFVNCSEDVGSHMIEDPKVNLVMLTGATQTAQHFIHLRPGLDLVAETGGKNTMIITAMADRDLAIQDLLQSSFGFSGQKCSAVSLAIIEKEIYEDPEFWKQLSDAAQSLQIGSSYDLSTMINPLIRLPDPNLKRAMSTLEEGERWVLEPKQDKLNPLLWSPGIKKDISKNNFTHQTEFFGPILGCMKADNLGHAIWLANGTPFGLTSGLHSLDEREHEHWLTFMISGNYYINRPTTGAIVGRQPFGGTKMRS